MSVVEDADDLLQRFSASVAASSKHSSDAIGLSVSGGGDSVAMMHLAARLQGPGALQVLTVDHRLRAEAKEEIALVARLAAELGLNHTVINWTWDGAGNLQASARDGRWAAIRQWALTYNLREVWLGHTEDDQVETVLMRLARGSGIDGLSAIYKSTQRDGLHIVRPLLDVSRADLRDWLVAHDIPWCDDPSNADTRFDRVRARQMFDQLETLGLTRKRLLQTVDHMQAAHLSLQKAAHQFAVAHVRQDASDLLIGADALNLEKADAPRRVMAAAFAWVGSRTYRPRFEQLCDTVAQARKGATVTLGGCIMSPADDGTVRLMREAAATRPTVRDAASDAQGVFWDKRWFLEGPLTEGLKFKALGEGIKMCPDWRESGMPRTSLLASPSVWQNDTLISAPMAGLSNGWSAQIVANFHTSAFAIED